LTDIVSSLSRNTGSEWTLENSYTSDSLDSPIDINETVKDSLVMIKTIFTKLQYIIEGTNLIVWNYDEGRTKTEAIEINYVSSPPNGSASGYTFTAPWNPRLKAGMRLKIDPKYFKQSYGMKQVAVPENLKCLSMVLEFNTVTSQNSMTVLALNTDAE